ncbi:MAG TPA: hypothetical protein ENI93_06435 [Gammaproteobacteria bacterium]|nr:hypothetical protein [Gammaproteobacteria bacterium]
MDTRDILNRLRTAKSAHLGWVNRARALIDGKPVDKEKVPVMPTDCIFGKWYYSDGRKLASLPSFQAIEEPHNRLHAIYQEIFDLLFTNEKGNFIARLFDNSRKQEQRREQARQKFLELQQMSDVIVSRLDALERDIRVMDQRLQQTGKKPAETGGAQVAEKTQAVKSEIPPAATKPAGNPEPAASVEPPAALEIEETEQTMFIDLGRPGE